MILTIAKAIGRRVHAVLEVLFPGPTDDVMAVAEAVGVTPEQVDAEESRAYHDAMCEAVELYADARVAEVGMQDFTWWRLEMSMRGEQS